MLKSAHAVIKEHRKSIDAIKVIRSVAQIMLLTVIFGALSYAFIQFNAAVMQISLPESLWCGLAMALAIAYYLSQRNRKIPASSGDGNQS